MSILDSYGVETFFSRVPRIDDYSDFSYDTFMLYSKILSEFFALWGNRFYLVKSDVDCNITKVSNAVGSLNVTSLRDMLAAERELKQAAKDSSGSVGLLWLKRTYEFLVSALWYLSQSDSKECMKAILLKAYNETLRKHHNKVMRQAFRLVLYALPKRSAFIQKLALDQENCEQLVLSGAADCSKMLKPILAQVNDLLVEYQLEDTS